MEIVGPYVSRRLGRVLGIETLPAGHCTLSCLHCPLAPPSTHPPLPRDFGTDPAAVAEAVGRRLGELESRGGAVDALVLKPRGEATLDARLGDLLKALRKLGPKVALFTNGTLLHRPEVSQAVLAADWVSLRVETTRHEAWLALNRPHPAVALPEVVRGLLAFSKAFPGTLVTETTLVKGFNDDTDHLADLARLLTHLRPFRSYLSFPPPSGRPEVQPPDPVHILECFEFLHSRLPGVRLLLPDIPGPEPPVGAGQERLLGLLAFRPFSERTLRQLLVPTGISWEVVERLVEGGRVQRLSFKGQNHYLRASLGWGTHRPAFGGCGEAAPAKSP
jgi:wyosine [tRNA(Phe)-imidazoG37] synthetase (radical SAM superfamily)